MIRALDEFDESIRLVREQTSIHDHLVNTLHLPSEYSSEILRSQLVYAVSAMDRFFHEVARLGFIESYKGVRVKTAKFLSWQFPTELMMQIVECSDSGYSPSSIQDTPEYLIEQDVVRKLSVNAYQHPDKIKEALSLIWDEAHKTQVIATAMGIAVASAQQVLEQKLKLICERRNQIVHEADIEPTSRTRRTINQSDVNDNVDFIEQFCHATYTLITSPQCYSTPAVTP